MKEHRKFQPQGYWVSLR